MADLQRNLLYGLVITISQKRNSLRKNLLNQSNSNWLDFFPDFGFGLRFRVLGSRF